MCRVLWIFLGAKSVSNLSSIILFEYDISLSNVNILLQGVQLMYKYHFLGLVVIGSCSKLGLSDFEELTYTCLVLKI
jgi:hypothetical protein